MKTHNNRESEIDFGRPLDIESGIFGQPLAPPPLAVPRRNPMSRAAKIGLGSVVVALVASISVMAVALTGDVEDPDEAAKWKIINEVATELAAIKARVAAEAEVAVVEPEIVETVAVVAPVVDEEPVETVKPIKKPVKKPVVKPLDKKPIEKKPVEKKPVDPAPMTNPELEKLINPDKVDKKNTNLQKTLTRQQVQAGMGKVAGAVKSCGNNIGGNVTVAVTIKGNGKVQSATVLGSHAGTAVGSCTARYVRRAKFPAFADPSLRVKYPFSI